MPPSLLPPKPVLPAEEVRLALEDLSAHLTVSAFLKVDRSTVALARSDLSFTIFASEASRLALVTLSLAFFSRRSRAFDRYGSRCDDR